MSGSLSFRHDFYVAHGNSSIGFDIPDKLKLAILINDTRLSRVHTCIRKTGPECILKQKFPKLFDSDTLGHAENFVLSSANDEPISPNNSKARFLPFAMEDHIEKECKKVCSLGVLQPCTNADNDWASPHVVSWRKNGSLRLCCDLPEVNKAIKNP